MAILSLHNIAKNFGAIQAIVDVSFNIDEAEIVGLMGDNGAGKSTLLKIIAGNFYPSAGVIKFENQEVHFKKPIESREAGIEVVYQDLALCNHLTAASNVFLGREIQKGIWPFKYLDYPSMFKKSAELFEELKSETRPKDLVMQMSGGQRQAVAIARTRLTNPKLVLMDEPTAAISVRQVAEVLDLIKRLKDNGISILLISHRMPDIFQVCDKLVVLRRGEKVCDKLIKHTSTEEATGLITGAIDRV
ncbi:MAG: sugar ABC transporter ATP-binding protein [Alphaproteobacteria bacterium]|nr:sugar ABC transporter ATP-binding protein [Alphaproteobacteria bacterium]